MENITTEIDAPVFDIQRFSLHDGPGIRTLVFFKGCSLRCAWCQNPEAIAPGPELAFYADRCRGHRDCLVVCESGALKFNDELQLDRELCSNCGECARVCPEEALRMIGRRYGIEELLAACLQDRDYYETSGGGVTLSGGEPVLQAAFLREFLPRLKSKRIHVLIETAGNYKPELLEEILPWLDGIFFDLKLPDAADYRAYTGSGNERILKNLKRLLAAEVDLLVRTPLVPGVNTRPEQVSNMIALCRELRVSKIHLLNYNRLWESKLARLGSRRQAPGFSESVDHAAIVAAFASAGIEASGDPEHQAPGYGTGGPQTGRGHGGPKATG